MRSFSPGETVQTPKGAAMYITQTITFNRERSAYELVHLVQCKSDRVPTVSMFSETEVKPNGQS